MTSYYDLVLALIPVVFGGIAAGLYAAGFSFTQAVPVAAFAAVLIIGHAMFIRSPVEQVGTVERRASGVGEIHAD